MLDFLSQILTVLEDLPNLFLTGLVDGLNAVFAGIGTLVTGLFALLPSMSDAPAIASGDWLGWLNWFLPVAQIMVVVTSATAIYILYLAVRYALSLVRAL